MQSDEKKSIITAEEVLLGIRFDLYVVNHALQFEDEMPPHERGGAYFAIMRIIQRMDDLNEKIEEHLEKILMA